VEVNLSLAQIVDVGQKLSSAHASVIVLKISDGLALVKLRLVRLKAFVELVENAVNAEPRLVEEPPAIVFFFMRLSIRLPAAAATCRETMGLIRR
jgi:hypothetical protein